MAYLIAHTRLVVLPFRAIISTRHRVVDLLELAGEQRRYELLARDLKDGRLARRAVVPSGLLHVVEEIRADFLALRGGDVGCADPGVWASRGSHSEYR